MGNANSRQKLARPLRNAAVALWERSRIRDGFQILLRRIKEIIGFDQRKLDVPQAEPQFSAQENAALTRPVDQTDIVDDSQHNRDFRSLDETVDALNMTEARAEDLAHLSETGETPGSRNTDCSEPNSNRTSNAAEDRELEIDSQDEDADSIVSSINRAIEEAFPVPSIRETYESKMQALDSVYKRLRLATDTPELPEALQRVSSSPTEPSEPRPEPEPEPVSSSSSGEARTSLNKDSGPIIDRWIDTEAAEYVFSTLAVALPEQQQSTPPVTEISFQRPKRPHVSEQVVIAQTDSPIAPEQQVDRFPNAPPPPEIQRDRDEQDALANYHWHKQVYTGLPLDQNSIRLVDIQPGENEDVVSVLVTAHSLDDVAMQYEALSYVWGDPKPAKHITVNGREMVPVNPNLFDALVSLREPDQARRVWIDALCLNQESLAEKSKQVQKMDRIYGLAKTVIVFLGSQSSPDSSSVDTLFQFLNKVDSAFHGKLLIGQTLASLCELTGIGADDVCKGFVGLCLQPWFGRIWTLQEFYLAKDEPVWHWGRARVNNASFKQYFTFLSQVVWPHIAHTGVTETTHADIEKTILKNKSLGSFNVDMERALELIWRRYDTHGFDRPRRLYRELTARATNPRDFIYGLRAIFDPVFGKVFVPDYRMRTELLFACLAVFLIQFESWGDVLWYYPARFGPGKGELHSWLPDFTKHVQPHEFDVQPLSQVEKTLLPKLVVLNHRLHAEGYMLDIIYGHRHLDQSDGQKILEELWQFDHSLNNNHECHKYYLEGASPDDKWMKVFLDMYSKFYAYPQYKHETSAFRGPVLQSTMDPEYADKLPRQVSECVPLWDVLQWHAFRTDVPGLSDGLPDVNSNTTPGCLEDIFSSRMDGIFQKAFADFFIGASIFDWKHMEIWLRRFPFAEQWDQRNNLYWFAIRELLPDDMDKRAQLIFDAYIGFNTDVWPEISHVHWCNSFYFSFFAYAILLDCDDHHHLASIIEKLQKAATELRDVYFGTEQSQSNALVSACPSVAARANYYHNVVDLFRGRYYIWTDGDFRGISCPGVELCGDKIAIVDGLSFPVILRDYNEASGEGRMAGCAVVRGVDMRGMDTEEAVLPLDYKKGKKKVFKFR